VIFGAVALSKTPEAYSTWAGNPIRIDGRSDDWQKVDGFFLDDQKAMFAFSNDNQFLYVLFRTTDLRWVRMIKRTGLTLYFDVAGGKKKDLFVRFKGGPSAEQLMTRGSGSNGREQMRTRRGEEFPPGGEQTPTLTCFIKDKIVEKLIPLDGTEGPAAAFDTGQGFYTYEFRIPLAKDSILYYGIGAAAGKQISFGGVWGERPEMKRDGDDSMRGRRSGVGGIPGMGGRGGGMGDFSGEMGGPHEGGNRSQAPQKQEVWIKTTLALPDASETPKGQSH
jgi:hypothetical protein